MKEKIYLFSYGSMKQGFKNHIRLEEDEFIAKAKTVLKYNMYPAESFNYPYAIEKEQIWQLTGELYKLTKTDIKEIDLFEGVPSHYYPKEIEVICNDKIYKAFIYFRTDTNPIGMDTDIPLDTWSKEFEYVGKKNDEFLDALVFAIKKSSSDSKVTQEFLNKFILKNSNNE